MTLQTDVLVENTLVDCKHSLFLLENLWGRMQRRMQVNAVGHEGRAWYAKPRAIYASRHSHSHLVCFLHCIVPNGFSNNRETTCSLLRTSRSTMLSSSHGVSWRTSSRTVAPIILSQQSIIPTIALGILNHQLNSRLWNNNIAVVIHLYHTWFKVNAIRFWFILPHGSRPTH